MIKNSIARVTAAIILITSVVALVFGETIGATEPSAEGFALLGLLAGSAGTFLIVGSRAYGQTTGYFANCGLIICLYL